MGNRLRVKSSEMAPGLANARPPGNAKFANAPQLPGGEGLGASGIG